MYLSNVTAPRLGRRPTDTTPGTPDELFAWDAREFLRKKLIGQMVTFIKDFTATSGRDHGRVYLGGTSNIAIYLFNILSFKTQIMLKM